MRMAKSSIDEFYAYYRRQDIEGYRIYGTPGDALRAAQHKEKDPRKKIPWVKGRLGERMFMSMLSEKGLLNKCVSFWSLRHDDWGEDCDLDCAFLFENALVLVDVKAWNRETENEIERNSLRKRTEWFESTLKDKGANVTIYPYIVFVPSADHEVHETIGNINDIDCLKYKDFLAKMERFCKDPGHESKQVETMLAPMTKRDKSYGTNGDEPWDNEMWHRTYADLDEKLRQYGAVATS